MAWRTSATQRSMHEIIGPQGAIDGGGLASHVSVCEFMCVGVRACVNGRQCQNISALR